MTITHSKLRELFKKFWQSKNHKEIPSAPLVLKEDPTTLFTSSGMQPLVPYLSGELHPLGKRLYDIQLCVRTQDIEEVGDLSHTTFFEMMGNWSLGDYFKKEQLNWYWDFLTNVLKLPKEKLYITVFNGYQNVPKDEETYNIWKKIGVSEDHIYFYEVDKNWWSRSGPPDQMPAGEIGGPDSEVFYDFGEELKLHKNSKYLPASRQGKNKKCHPNCQCGRFLEIGNSVFIQYRQKGDGALEELPQKNVDFGGGLERILAAISNNPDIFQTDVFIEIIKEIEKQSNKKYSDFINQHPMRIIADHLKAATVLASQDLEPSNKSQGYVMRRLIRRSVVKMMQLDIVIEKAIPAVCEKIVNIYSDTDLNLKKWYEVHLIIGEEADDFEQKIHSATKLLQNKSISGKLLFDLQQSYGLPFEIAEELLKQWNKPISDKERKEFNDELNKHKELSRKTSINMFKGGLADQSEQTIKYHTATHLIHQSLFDILGNDVKQEGSNITNERLRFDFYSLGKPTEDAIKQVQKIVNGKIDESLPVDFKILPKDEAYKVGAKAFFKQKYPDMVKVYFIGNYSKEFCGGPHVKNTKEIGQIQIYKFEKIGSNLYRIYAI